MTGSGPGAGPPQPTRWKLWLLLVMGIYPVITALVEVGQPVLGHLPLWARFAVIVPMVSAVMVWVVLPLLHRWFGDWLAS